jgi:flagellar biosynthesis/type III secretory pathway chaperone
MDIRDILNYEVETLSELDELLDIEREVLINDRANELAELIEKKKLIAKKISLLEKKRQELYGDKAAEEFVNEGILDRELFNKIKKLTDIVKEKSETNLILTKQSIGYIRMVTSALNPNQKVVTYGNSGKIGDGTSQGLFTTTV